MNQYVKRVIVMLKLEKEWIGDRGFWEYRRKVLFHIDIINSDATSYCTSAVQSLFDDTYASDEKRSKYGLVAKDRRACFTPMLAICEAIFDHEAYMKRLATSRASKWWLPLTNC